MSTEQDIERWTELVAAEGRGTRLTEGEQTFRAALERDQPELVIEASLWRALGEHGAGRTPAAAPAIGDAEMCAAVLCQAREAAPPIALRRAPRRLGPALAVAAGLALAFGLPMILSAPPTSPSRIAVNEPSSAAPMMSAPPVESQVLWLTPGKRTRLEPASCAAVTDDLEVCARTAAIVEQVASASATELRLLAGAIEVLGADDPLSVSVETPAGTITGQGATFIVTLGDEHTSTTVSVLAGEVDLRDTAGVREPIAAGRAGALPLAPEPVAPRAAKPRPAVVRTAVASPGALLESAQQQLTAGDTAQAILGYETLLKHHPRSVEGRTALVSLGNLLLLRGQPARALRYFDRYLEHGGELAEEALHGRISALRRLGRADQARAACAEFLALHGESLYAPHVRAWADSLGEDD